MLQKQVIPVPLTGGLDTKTDDKSLPIPALTIAENARRDKAGKLQKRHGVKPLGLNIINSDLQIRGSDALGVYKDELLIFNKSKVYSYAECPDQVADKGSWVSAIVDTQDVTKNDFDQTQVDTAHICGLSIFAWEDSRGGVRYSIQDNTTGALVVSDKLLDATATHPRCIAFKDFLYILYVVSGELRGVQVSPTNAALSTPVVISSVLNTTNIAYGLIAHEEYIALAYNVDSATQINVIKLNATLGIISSTSIAEAGEVIELCAGFEEDTYVAFYNGTAVRVIRLKLDLTVGFALKTIDTVADVSRIAITDIKQTPGIAIIYYEIPPAAPVDRFIKVTSISHVDGSSPPGAVFLRGVGIASRAWGFGTNTFLTVVHQSTLQSTFFVARSGGLICAKIRYGVAGGVLARNYASNVNVLGENKYQIGILSKNQLISLSNNTLLSFKGVSLANIDLSDKRAFQVKELGGNGLIVGGVVGSYDSQSVVEHGFHLFPEGITLAESTGGNLSLTNTYSYRVVWYWTDNLGRLHRSAPSIPVQITLTGSNNRVTLTIPTLRLTEKKGTRTNVVVAVFRTEGFGVNYYRASDPVTLTYNDPTVDSITIVDDLSDANLIAREVLYTQGGIIENVAPPTSKIIAVHRKRAWVVDEDDRLWYSKEVLAGRTVEFSDQFIQEIDPIGGRITALSNLGEKLVIFKESSICYIFGDGPDERGQGGIFSYPQFITEHIGCIDPKSIARIPEGILFRSRNGIYLLTNDLQVTYIGAAVEKWNKEEIASVVVVADDSEVRFLTKNSNCLVYNYFFREWYTFTNYQADDAVLWKGSFVFLKKIVTEQNIVVIEDKTSYRDISTYYSMKIGLAWASFAGIQGLQRIWRVALLGDYKSPHRLKISLGYDYTKVIHDEYLWNPDEITGDDYGASSPYGESSFGGQDLPYQVRAHVRRQKCQTLRVIVEDIGQEGSGESFSLSGVSFEVGVKKGLAKLKSGQTL